MFPWVKDLFWCSPNHFLCLNRMSALLLETDENNSVCSVLKDCYKCCFTTCLKNTHVPATLNIPIKFEIILNFWRSGRIQLHPRWEAMLERTHPLDCKAYFSSRGIHFQYCLYQMLWTRPVPFHFLLSQVCLPHAQLRSRWGLGTPVLNNRFIGAFTDDSGSF